MPVSDWKFIAKRLGENGQFQWSIANGERAIEGTVDKNYVPLAQVQLEGENVVLESQY